MGLPDKVGEGVLSKLYDDLLHKTVVPVGDVLSIVTRVLRWLFSAPLKWLDSQENQAK